ncbi:MAG: discoidin domain-containing protein, partial [Muribaculaceae bacterium]|nr:discoidin domain-containing protein [Muribaculaceae bacterium]
FMARLDILVEAMGRINFGRAIKDFKGITDKVTVTEDRDGHNFVCELSGWQVYNLEDVPEFYTSMRFRPLSESDADAAGRLPRGVYRGTFTVDKPGDTFLDFETWGKGLVYVNGHALGRIWEIGPQQTLYMPGCWLKKGENEIVVFDILGPKEARSEGHREPVLDKLLVTRRLIHREEGQELDLSGETAVLQAAFQPGNGWQERKLEQPLRGRYLCFEALDGHNADEMAAIAEFYVLDDKGERLSREPWIVDWADSEEVNQGNRSADKLFDLQESTYWSTVPGAAFPHSFVIDLGAVRNIGGIQYLPRMEQGAPGSIKNYKVYIKNSPFKL